MLDVQAAKVKKNFCKSLQNLNKREIIILGAYFQSQQLEINGLLLEKAKKHGHFAWDRRRLWTNC